MPDVIPPDLAPPDLAILTALADGTAREPAELAAIAGVSRAAAGACLRRLAGTGLVAVERDGARRFHLLTPAGLARLLDRGASAMPPDPALPHRRGVGRGGAEARSCHGHLGGRLGAGLVETLLAAGWLRPGEGRRLIVTASGRGWLRATFNLDAAAIPPGREGVAWRCPGARPGWHLGGPLGLWLLRRMLAAGWFTEDPRSRALAVTETGAAWFAAPPLPAAPPPDTQRHRHTRT